MPAVAAEFAPDDLAPGVRRLASLDITLERVEQGDAATFAWSVRNASDREVQLESVVMGFRWLGHGQRCLRFLRHGWQSWSVSDVCHLDGSGEPVFPSGEWLRGMHHSVGAPPADREGWYESEIVSVAGGMPSGGACLAGVLETGSGFGVVYLRSDGEGLDLEVEVRVEAPLGPGETRHLEGVRVALGHDPNRLLERFAELWGRRAGARTGAPFQTGWCSWYHFFHEVREEDVLRSLEVLARARETIPVDVVQLDDGYQRAVGDWLECSPKFPRGLEWLAGEIRSAGFSPGIWTAPFCVVPESHLFERHPDWLLRNGEELFCGVVNPVWTKGAAVHVLDTSQEPVRRHLTDLFRRLAELGFRYLKLDFLHSVAMRCDARDPRLTRAERLRCGLQSVRDGAGEDAFLLGCGSPLGPAVGIVDAMRIGPDVAPSWAVEGSVGGSVEGSVVPGLEGVLPSLRNALRNVLHRTWMHRRLWINDPDCLLERSQETKLTREEKRTFASAVAVSGGMVVFSDDPTMLSAEDRAELKDTLHLARDVDAAGGPGVARLARMLEGREVRCLVADRPDSSLIALVNLDDREHRDALSFDSLGMSGPSEPPDALLGSKPPEQLDARQLEVALGPHESALYRLSGVRSLAVFCDFDGTFSVQDVGATIARERVGAERPALWAQYERGEISAWEYNMVLLDGLVMPEAELDAFLDTIELDPGARRLLSWCEGRGVPLRILSDGFDTNLERLQRIHGIHFEYAANGLRYQGDTWRITPGHPDPSCGCGTGTCKRGCITAYRSEHPGAFCVHIGNGVVSDLCGALVADLTFAKDSLAQGLDERGVAYQPFQTLHDVVSRLEALAPSRRSGLP